MASILNIDELHALAIMPVSEITEEPRKVVGDTHPVECPRYLPAVMGGVVQDVEDGLPDNTLLILSLVVLELEGLLEVIGFHFLQEGDIKGVDLLQEGRELGEVISDLRLQGIDFLVENSSTERRVISQNHIPFDPRHLIPEAVLEGAEDGFVVSARLLDCYVGSCLLKGLDHVLIRASVVFGEGQDNVFHGNDSFSNCLLFIILQRRRECDCPEGKADGSPENWHL